MMKIVGVRGVLVIETSKPISTLGLADVPSQDTIISAFMKVAGSLGLNSFILGNGIARGSTWEYNFEIQY